MIELALKFVGFFLHIDTHLSTWIAEYGALTYVILFLIVFCETGLVIAPFLPGDSLLFAAGAFAARGAFNPFVLFALLSIAAILGDTVNYSFGSFLGTKVFEREYRWLNRKHLMVAETFYEKHGAKTIMFARFLPVLRTLAPFVAGVSNMHYPTFVSYNVGGGILWAALFVFGGYFFGSIPFVEENFSMVIIAIIAISLLPGSIHWLRHWLKTRKAKQS